MTAADLAELSFRESSVPEPVEQPSYDYHRTLLQNIPQRVFFKDLRSTFVMVNASFAADLGMRPQDFVGKTDYDLFPAEFARKYRADDQRVMTTGLAEVVEEVNLLNGRPRIVEVIKTPVVNDQEEVIGILGLFVDITERKNAEKALREGERKYRTLFNHIADPIFIFDRETARFLDCNQSVRRIYGYTLDELRTMTPLELRPPHERDAAPPNINSGNVELPCADTHITKAGIVMAVEMLTEEIEYEGRPASLSIVRNVTERRRVETERQVNFEIIQGISTTANLDELLTLVHEALRKIVSVENFYIALYDRATDQLNTQFFLDRYDEPHPPQALGRGRTAYVFRTGRPALITADVFRTLIERGEVEEVGTPPAAWVGVPLKTPSERIGVLVVQHYEDALAYTTRDVEFLTSVGGQIALAIERKQAEEKLKTFAEKLERSNRELEEFASVASHDLQEPLRKIQAFGDRLKAKCGDTLNDTGRDYLERMQRAAVRMQALIDGLLMFSRVTTKGRPFSAVDLGEVACEVISDLEVRLEQTSGQVELGEMMTLDADPLQMRQLLQNLMGNALKFHHAGAAPVVKISCARISSESGAEVCQITVSDNGIGFDEKYLDRIFNVFQRLRGRLEYEGTGVGLAVCRRIAERHGGSITARSKPGCGATFIITLPITQTTGEMT